MADRSPIPWCDATINPFGWGCYGPDGTPSEPRVCPYCYAHRMSKRKLRGCAECRAFRPHWHPEEIDKLARWKRPRKIFVCSMADPFGNGVDSLRIQQLLFWLSEHPRHTIMMLTKCAARMRSEVTEWSGMWRDLQGEAMPANFWLGVSITNQHDADERIPLLLQTPAAVRFVSAEPLLSNISIEPYLWLSGPSTAGPWRDALGRKRGGGGIGGQAISSIPSHDINWAIVGAQTGPGARPCEPAWVQALIDQCRDARVPVFVKGAALRKVFPIQEWPEAS